MATIQAVLVYRLAIVWAVLFAAGSICSCILASLQGVDWVSLTGQKKLLIVLAICSNVFNVLMAFISKEAKSIQVTGSPTFVADAPPKER